MASQNPPATQEPQYPIVSIGTLSYLQYDAELKNREGFNAFDITRGYINIVADLAKNLRFRVTPDVKRVTDGSLGGNVAFRVKYAFLEFDNLTPRSWLRVGAHQTPWLDFEEGINRYRVQGKMFSEREGVIPSSSDFGVGYLTQFSGMYGELQAGVYNGEGSEQAETSKAKSVQARLTIRPFPAGDVAQGFRVSGFYDLGWFAPDRSRRHGIVMGTFEHKNFVGMVQWLAATDRPAPLLQNVKRRGYSAFVEVRQGLEGWAGFVRFDNFDPNRSRADDSDRRTIAGVAYWLHLSRVRTGLVFNDEDVRYGAGQNKPDENRLLVQTHVQF